jgi:hypothetical protein
MRLRATRDEIEARRAAFHTIIAGARPMTVRQVFYQATVHGLVEKTEAGYAKVQSDLVLMRRTGALPYDWLADNTRWQRKPATYSGISDLLEEAAALYRRNLWRDSGCYVEVWLEKDALSGVVYPVTERWDVPLMVSRGYASLSFLQSAAEQIAALECAAHIYHLGDFDPSGVNAGEKIEETLRELAPEAEINFERIAVNPDQITAWSLPTRPTKTTDSRAARFGHADSVELDAIDPNRLRQLVNDAIEQHVDQRQLEIIQEAEASERRFLEALAMQVAR